MKATRQKTEKDLKNEGFKPVKGFESLFIDKTGKVYNLKTGKYLKPNSRNYIQPEKKYLSVPKLILMTFEGADYRNGQIHYIDGNRANLSPENIKYSRLFNKEQNRKLNEVNLITAIRCYFEIDPKFKIKDNLKKRVYLQSILEKRNFFTKYKSYKFIEVLYSYIGGTIINQNSISKTAKIHSLTVRDCFSIINGFLSLLIAEIQQDIENGFLHVLNYSKPKRTQKDSLQDFKEYLKTL